MSRLPEKIAISEDNLKTSEDLLVFLDRLYTDLARAINQKPDIVQRTVNGTPTDGSPSDSNLNFATINVNTATNKVEMLTNYVDSQTVTWTTLS